MESEPATPEEERDTIFTLLAVAAVAATWDESPLGDGPGHNIGAVLVDKNDTPVAFARNESTGRRDLTEHAELRLIRGYIAASSERTELHKHSIYTTLEPCAMCAGMMAMTNVRRTVFAQPDPLYGGVFQRLAAGERPYPKHVESRPARDASLGALCEAFAGSGFEETIAWLPTPGAREAFETCARAFSNYTPRFARSDRYWREAQAFLANITPIA